METEGIHIVVDQQEDHRVAEAITHVLDAAVAIGLIWISLNPRSFEQFLDRVQVQWQRLQHSRSVGQALRAIRKLPETKVPEETEKEK